MGTASRLADRSLDHRIADVVAQLKANDNLRRLDLARFHVESAAEQIERADSMDEDDRLGSMTPAEAKQWAQDEHVMWTWMRNRLVRIAVEAGESLDLVIRISGLDAGEVQTIIAEAEH
ncbi:hypothetical protein ABJI51_16880 [Amycolatopsis sp. NEAU-NG30]|uniref:Uncharacterized protein n=1 Tax=Amycolatopsis melonis TaxID=3156488 RepID=A0ABV0LEN3_9PSEU